MLLFAFGPSVVWFFGNHLSAPQPKWPSTGYVSTALCSKLVNSSETADTTFQKTIMSYNHRKVFKTYATTMFWSLQLTEYRTSQRPDGISSIASLSNKRP